MSNELFLVHTNKHPKVPDVTRLTYLLLLENQGSDTEICVKYKYKQPYRKKKL